jgi:hypothetical protein
LPALNYLDVPHNFRRKCEYAVAPLVKAQRYKPEGPGVDSASNRNTYWEYFRRAKGGRCVGLIILPHLCADYLEIWEFRRPGILRDFSKTFTRTSLY